MQEENNEIFDTDNPEIAQVDETLIDTDWSGEAVPENTKETDGTQEERENTTVGSAEPKAQESGERFKLKYMGREMEVDKDELITLAQKGKDYDRIRSRADALNETLKKSGDSPDLAGPDGAQQRQSERRTREVSEFMSEYGSVDPRAIPKEVWESVSAGKTLLGAYQSYENKSLKARLEAERKNRENARRTAGSRKSVGGTRARGAIEDDWYKDD